MKKICYRNQPLSGGIAVGILGLLCIVVSAIMLKMILSEGSESASILLVIIITFFVFLPGLCLIGYAYVECFTFIEISDKAVAFLWHNKMIWEIPKEKVSLVICTGFFARSKYIVFCAVPEDDIASFWNKNKYQAEVNFEKWFASLYKSPEGRWQMAVALYVQKKCKISNRKCIRINYITPSHIEQIEKMWDIKIMRVGPAFWKNHKW